MRGDPGNKSEEIEAVEVGYQGVLRDCLLLTVSLFQNRMDHLITTSTVSYYPPPLQDIPREMAFLNALSWQSRGGETSFRADPFPWLTLSGQYSYVWLEDTETGVHIARAPVHAASLTARARPMIGHHLQLTSRFRGESLWSDSYIDVLGDEPSEGRLVLDAAWQVLVDGGGHRVTLAVENLFDRRYRDHPETIEHRRRWMASVTLNF
jgi:outer membrane receptor protein involved in Fe transport